MGGNSITFQHDGFRFDSGAHRFHDRDPEMTGEVKRLLGNALRRIDLPSRIYQNGKWIHFPFKPLNLVVNLGPFSFLKSSLEILWNRFHKSMINADFRSVASYRFGETLSSRFLLNYSQKLWGLPCDRLSSSIAGNRLGGMKLKTFLKEMLLGNKLAKHLEGVFYYPELGIGQLMKKLEDACGSEACHGRQEVTRIFHSENRIDAIEINGKNKIETDRVVSTLSLDRLLGMMDPSLPKEIRDTGSRLHYRNLILVAFFIDKPVVTKAATVYFPDPEVPFTRVYEPRNRSPYMAPKNKTSLVAEIPCSPGDTVWESDKEDVIRIVKDPLMKIGLFEEESLIGAKIVRLEYTYPVLELGHRRLVERIHSYLARFENLILAGRNGRFVYSWIHDMLRSGREIVDALED